MCALSLENLHVIHHYAWSILWEPRGSHLQPPGFRPREPGSHSVLTYLYITLRGPSQGEATWNMAAARPAADTDTDPTPIHPHHLASSKVVPTDDSAYFTSQQDEEEEWGCRPSQVGYSGRDIITTSRPHSFGRATVQCRCLIY